MKEGKFDMPDGEIEFTADTKLEKGINEGMERVSKKFESLLDPRNDEADISSKVSYLLDQYDAKNGDDVLELGNKFDDPRVWNQIISEKAYVNWFSYKELIDIGCKAHSDRAWKIVLSKVRPTDITKKELIKISKNAGYNFWDMISPELKSFHMNGKDLIEIGKVAHSGTFWRAIIALNVLTKKELEHCKGNAVNDGVSYDYIDKAIEAKK